MTCSGRSAARRASSTSAAMKSVMPLTSACSSRFPTGADAPFEVRRLRRRAVALEARRGLQEPLGRVGPAIEDHVLAQLAQFRVDLVVDGELAGIDDAHVHADPDGVVEEHRMHRLAHRLVAAEGEGQVRHAARDMGVRQRLADGLRRLDEGDAVAVVLLDPGRDREHVRVEDDVLRREADLFGEDPVGAGADRDLSLEAIGLAVLVEGHDHDGGAVGAADPRLGDELLLALLHRDRVHDRLALDAFQAGLDDVELRRVRPSPARGRCRARRRRG